jgi:regulator of RNase E activity RraA
MKMTGRIGAFLILNCLATGVFAQAPPARPGGQRPQPAQMAPQTLPDQVKLFIPYKEYSQEDNNRILKMYEFLRVSDVSDGMDVVGLKDVGVVDQEIKALWRDTDNFTHRVVGIAVTARYVPTNKRVYKMEPAEIGRWYRDITPETFMPALFPGSVLVIDAEGDGESRTIGSSNILAWRKAGMRAVITGGGLADSDEIIHHKVPAYYKRLARGIRPGRNELESVNRPVTLGGVLVRPGDVVVADGDGVVVVPREHAEEVAKASMQFLDNVQLERFKKANPGVKIP